MIDHGNRWFDPAFSEFRKPSDSRNKIIDKSREAVLHKGILGSKNKIVIVVSVALIIGVLTLVLFNYYNHSTANKASNVSATQMLSTSILPSPNYMMGSNETYLSESVWPTNITGNGKFNVPTDVAVNSSGSVYVTDTYNNRIPVFSRVG